MYTKLENINIVINKLKKEDWETLFKLIPEIENIKDFEIGEGYQINPENPEEAIIKPTIEAKIVWDVVEELNKLDLLIDFDWGNWNVGREIASNQDYENRDTITLLKLISAFIRNNRFCDGALAGRFADGSIEKILRQIRENIENE